MEGMALDHIGSNELHDMITDAMSSGMPSKTHVGRPPALALALLVGTGAVAGCARMSPTLRRAIGAEAASLTPAVSDSRAVAAAGAAVVTGDAPPPGDWKVPEDAGLGRYVREALVRSPAIHRAIREVQALGYVVPQVTSLDDPMVKIVPPTGDMLETAAGMMDGSVGVSQKLPFPGKLAHRGRVAEQAARIALDRLADVRIRTIASVRKAYYDYYLADESIRLTRESARLLRQIRDVAAARYRAGAATQQDVLRAEVELYSLTNDVITLEQGKATATARLNALMNRRVDAALPPPRAPELAEVEWKLADAMDRAVASNPRLAALRDQVQRDLERVKLARLDYLPDLTVGYGYTFITAPSLSPVATGKDAWDLSLGLNLPIWWQRLRARVLEGNAQVLGSVAEYEDERNLVFFGLQDALVHVDTWYRQGVLYRDLIIPRAWQAVEVSLSSYQAGDLAFEPLVQNWRKWIDLSLSYRRALASLEQSFADLEQLVGVQIGRSPPGAATPDTEGSTQP
jgi:cobalt-zinc-cadmium efflux system outer membrane protein